jgi:hypothetical protein
VAKKFHASNESLNTENTAGCQEEARAESIGRVIVRLLLAPEIPNCDLAVAVLKITGVEVLHDDHVAFDHFASDKIGFVDFLRHIPEGGTRVDSFVVFFVYLPERLPV